MRSRYSFVRRTSSSLRGLCRPLIHPWPLRSHNASLQTTIDGITTSCGKRAVACCLAFYVRGCYFAPLCATRPCNLTFPQQRMDSNIFCQKLGGELPRLLRHDAEPDQPLRRSRSSENGERDHAYAQHRSEIQHVSASKLTQRSPSGCVVSFRMEARPPPSPHSVCLYHSLLYLILFGMSLTRRAVVSPYP